MADIVITNQSKNVIGPGESMSVTFNVVNPDVSDMDLAIAVTYADGSVGTLQVPVTFENGVTAVEVMDITGRGYVIEETTDAGQHAGWRFRVTAPATF